MAETRSGLLDKTWVETQAKVFSRWFSAKLEPRSITVADVRTDLADGVKLLNLLEEVGGQPIAGPWHHTVTGVSARFLALENVRFAITHMQTVLGIKIMGIQPEHITDNNEKMTLGLAWHIIHHFLSKISFEDDGLGQSGRVGEARKSEDSGLAPLLRWVQKKLSKFPGVNVVDMAKSWANGVAFCAILAVFRPNLLDPSTLDLQSQDKAVQLANLTRVFDIMRKLGIRLYLDPEDVIGPLDDPSYVPDDKSIWTQIAELHRFFGSDAITASQLLSVGRDSELSIQSVLQALDEAYAAVVDTNYKHSVSGIKKKQAAVEKIDHEDQKAMLEQRAKAEGMLSALVRQATAAGKPPPERPAGLEPETLDAKFAALEEAVRRRTKELAEELYAAEQKLLEDFNHKCVALLWRAGKVRTEGDELTGATPDERKELLALQARSKQLEQESEQLKTPWQRLIDLGLGDRIKHRPVGVQDKVRRVAAGIKAKVRRAEGYAVDEAHQRVERYNAKAIPLLQEAQDIDDAVIQNDTLGDLAMQIEALQQKRSDITFKREVAKGVLLALYLDVQQPELAHDVQVTPARVDAAYAATLSRIEDDLVRIQEELDASQRTKSQPALRQVSPVLGQKPTARKWVVPRRTKCPCIIGKAQRSKTTTSGLKTKELQWEVSVVENPLDGIIAFMTKKTGRNLHDAGIVLVTSSPPVRPDERVAAKNVLDLLKDTVFCSVHKKASEDIAKEPNNWICYDFQDLQIIPTHYTIRSCFGGVNGFNLKNWVVETSVDSKKWDEADRRDDNTKLNGFNITRTFKVTGRHQGRYIRLVNIGRNHNGNDALSLSSFEIFGFLIDLSAPLVAT
jgi:hypothetical protein